MLSLGEVGEFVEMPAHPLHWRAQLWVNPPRGEAEEDVEELAGEAPRGTHGPLRLGSRARPETAKSETGFNMRIN